MASGLPPAIHPDLSPIGFDPKLTDPPNESFWLRRLIPKRCTDPCARVGEAIFRVMIYRALDMGAVIAGPFTKQPGAHLQVLHCECRWYGMDRCGCLAPLPPHYLEHFVWKSTIVTPAAGGNFAKWWPDIKPRLEAAGCKAPGYVEVIPIVAVRLARLLRKIRQANT